MGQPRSSTAGPTLTTSTDVPEGWLHTSELVERHTITVPNNRLADVHAAEDVCRTWAQHWLDAQGVYADIAMHSRQGRNGVAWTIEVGHAESTTPGGGTPEDWTWSARVHDWARALRRFSSPLRTGRIGRTTDDEGAQVVRLFGDGGVREDRGHGVAFGGSDTHNAAGEECVLPPDLYGVDLHDVKFTSLSEEQRRANAYTLEALPIRLGEPSGHFRITGGGLPKGGVEGQSDPRTGPTAEDIKEALKRGDVERHPLATNEVADARPPFLRRAEGWDEIPDDGTFASDMAWARRVDEDGMEAVPETVVVDGKTVPNPWFNANREDSQ